MTTPSTKDWYPEIARAFTLRGTLMFAFVGSLHRVPEFTFDYVCLASNAGTARAFGLDDPALFEWIEETHSGDTAVIDPDCPRLSIPEAEDRLSNLRPLVQQARERGVSTWFVSAKPLMRFPALAGSSLLVDAETLRVLPLDDLHATQIATNLGATPEAATRIAQFARGSRALVHAFSTVETSTESGNKKRQHAAEVEQAIALSALDDLGPDLASLLESWVFESQLQTLEADEIPSESIQSALFHSGLIARGSGETCAILPFENRSVWVEALAAWVGGVIDPPKSWTRVASELFALERDLRQQLSLWYQAQHGNGWKELALTELSASILDLARKDGVLAASSLGDLRSPLDWVQLSQLLELAAEASAVGTFLGLRAIEWHNVGSDVLAVRNRIAHMRLIRSGDYETVKRARRLVELRRGRG